MKAGEEMLGCSAKLEPESAPWRRTMNSLEELSWFPVSHKWVEEENRLMVISANLSKLYAFQGHSDMERLHWRVIQLIKVLPNSNATLCSS